MKQAIKRTVAAILSISLLVPVVASAHAGHDYDEVPVADKANQEVQTLLQNKKRERVAKSDTQQAGLQERLDSSRKKICEHHKSSINTTIQRMNERRKNAFDRITKISDAVLTYSNKKSLSFVGYDAVVAKISAAKSAAKSMMDTQSATKMLNCDSERPRADMLAFTEKRLDSVDAMALYGESVKELITSVKQATKEARLAKGLEG